jgi:hypothetical protein
MAPPLRRLRTFSRATGASRALKTVARWLGFDLLGRSYYSPIPDIRALPDELWTDPSELRGLTVDVPSALDFLLAELSPFLAEFAPPRQSTGDPRDFYLENDFYECIDAGILYAMVRRFQPRCVIEMGSGMSTLVIADARKRSGIDGRTSHYVYDPYPRGDLIGPLQEVAHVRCISATDVPLREFGNLQAGDFLFVDTTHTVKVGGEVNRLILDVLPSLSPGVLVHFHDIFLPWEYPRDFLTERSFFWSEQYLLQAFLAFNLEFEVVLPVHALHRQFTDEVARLFPLGATHARSSAFWLRRAEHQ